jgi:Tfp pilus assembly PilM family ATPase
MSFLSLGKVRNAAMNTLQGGVLPIAIDFGVGALKLLQLAPGDPPSLVAAASLETPEALLADHAKRYQFQFQALARVLKGAGFKGKRAVCAIPAGQTFIKHMQFPRSDNLPLAELVQVGVPAALNCDRDALILRHFAVEGANAPGSATAGDAGAAGGVKQEVICMAAARDFVQRIMGALRAANLECVGIHPEAVATVKAFEHINRRAGDAHVSTLYLDLAAGTTKVWIAHGSTLIFAKTIQLGGRDLDAAVARALDVSTVEARARRHATAVLVAPAARPASCTMAPGQAGLAAMNADGSPAVLAKSDPATLTAADRRQGRIAPGLTPQVGDQAAADVAPAEFDLGDALDNLTDEIAMCLRYYEAMFPGPPVRRVDRAIFFGGEARHRGLCQHIARKIRLPAQVADPLARMARSGSEPVRGVDFTTPQPGWTIPFGLCMCPTDL